MGISAFLPLLARAREIEPEAIRCALDAVLVEEHRQLFPRKAATDFVSPFDDEETGLILDERRTRGHLLIGAPRCATWREVVEVATFSRDERVCSAIDSLTPLAPDSYELRRDSLRLHDSVEEETGKRQPNPSLDHLRVPRFDQQSLRAAARVTRAAFRFLRNGNYPRPFTFRYWFIHGERLVWSEAAPLGGSILTPYGLSPNNVDFPPDFHIVADEHDRHAVQCYRIIELAYEIRWLASRSFDQVSNTIGDLRPSNRQIANQVLAVRTAEFGAAAAEWHALAERDAKDTARRLRKLEAFGEVAKLNRERSREANLWRPRALKRHNELVEQAPNAPLASIVHIIVTELRSDGEGKPSDRAVYKFLWDERRRRRLAG